MKILLGLDSWYPNVDGVVRTVENYAKYLSQDGECQVAVPSYDGVKTGEPDFPFEIHRTSSAGVPFLHTHKGALPAFDWNLSQSIRQGDFELLHAHSPFTMGDFFAKHGAKANVPTVFTFHTKFRDEFLSITGSEMLTKLLLAKIMKTINLFDYVVAVSDNAAATLREYGYRKPIKVIRNGTDMAVPTAEQTRSMIHKVNEEYGLAEVANVFLYVGRVVPVKNLPFSFEVLKKLKERGVDFRFLVVGGGNYVSRDGDYVEEYKKQVAEMGLSDEVIFTGAVTDRAQLQAFYSRADLLLFPSVFDNASITMIEAASCALPSMVPSSSSSAETLTDMQNGFVADLDAEVWADKLQKILADKEKLAEVAVNAQKTVYRSWRDVVTEVESFYADCIARKSAENFGKRKKTVND